MQRNPFSTAYHNAGYHNSIYRGKYLGNTVTAEQYAQIFQGLFEDLYIGDYWTINGVNWRIAHFDYWYGVGDYKCTTHHVVIVPDSNLYSAKMNDSHVTTGGYYNSKMRGGANYLVSGSSNLYQASEDIKSAFGSSHILAYRTKLTNATSGGVASGWSWYDSTVDLMSEVMLYGTLAWSVVGKGYEVGAEKNQFALYRHNISILDGTTFWLRGVVSSDDFARLDSRGDASMQLADQSLGVRPCFAIK